MGKKAKLYLLAVINLIVWGYVGYKIYKALEGDDDLSFDRSSAAIKKIEPEQKENAVILSLDYTDPFLKNGNFSGDQRSSNKAYSGSGTNKPKAAVSKQVVAAPLVQASVEFRYLGLVKNSETKTETAMLSVNGRSLLVKQNDVVEGYVIKLIHRDSIVALKGKKDRLIIKR